MVVERGMKKRVPSGRSFSDGCGGESSNSGDGLRTYKRRKTSRHCSEENLNVQEQARLFVEAAGQLAGAKGIKQQQDQMMRISSQEKTGLSRIDTLPSQGSDDFLHGQWRNCVLQRVSESLDESGGGIGSCIQDALASGQFINGVSEQTAECQVSHNYHDDKRKESSETVTDLNVSLNNMNAAEDVGVASDGSKNKKSEEANVHVTELCQRVFHDAIVSENFAMLCKLLCEHFQGIKVDRFSEFNIINSRMRDGVYGVSPVLFFADTQKLWRNFQKIGTEMASLAKGLSDMSRVLYREKFPKMEVGGSVNGTCKEVEHEEINCFGSDSIKGHPSVESDSHRKLEQSEVSGVEILFTCRHCGSKAEGRDCLVCDSCEEMYHVSCVGLPGGCIPNESWFCNNCFDARLMSAHESCVVCEKMNSTRTKTQVGGDEKEPVDNDVVENSGCHIRAEDVHAESSKRTGCTCKLCGCDLKDDGVFRLCMHPHCPNKYYHERCLTSQQLKSYGPRWYCPSCLCRKCLTDQDDDKVVLCDGCDHAYHIYCMNPPRSSIPRGKWFCKLCEKRIRAIRKAKMMFENLGKRKDAVDTPVDMLLSAAEKLKYEEKLASPGEKK